MRILVVLFLVPGLMIAQNITQAEYYFDTDPGFGMGTTIPFTPGSDVTLNFNADLSGLTPGLHVLYVRCVDANGKWTMMYRQPFVKESRAGADPAPNIVAVEYFMDADPGLGQATQVAVTPAPELTQAFSANLSSVSSRLHILYVRALSAEGKWGISHRLPIVREASDATSPRPDITSVEYFLSKSGVSQAVTSLTSFTPEESVSVSFDLDLTSLELDSTYELHVYGKNQDGFRGIEYVHGFQVISDTPPAAPQNLVVTDSSSRTITVKWRKNTEADFLRYRVYRGTSPNPTTKVDSTTGGTVSDTSKTFAGLTDGTRYYVRVTAVDSADNESPYSNEVNAAPGDRSAPAAPAGLVVTDSSNNTITVKWRKNTDADFLRYRIYRGTSPSPATKADSTTAGIADTSRTFTGLTNGTRYYFRVTAVDSAGNESAYSNEVSAVPADRIAPAAPQNLVVTDSTSTKIGLKWGKNAEADFLRYRIYRATSPNPATKVDSTTAGSTDTSKTFTGLSNGTRYYLRITAVDSAGNESAFSNEVNAAPDATLAVEDLMNQIPKEFSLAQNYPNPFNPSTIIRYGLPERSRVKLVVYDMLGREVAVLVNDEQEARFYETTWNANAPTGIYFYRITAVAAVNPDYSFTQVKRMILLR
ncbi:MAG: fibronectin type III domain-containing protein [Ignavibacteriales bacterium]|nr:fibronectin type III domain-containing protein [Ignavibacteriales bacterium]